MVPWRMMLGVVLGAVFVKEFRTAERAYDLIREKVVASLGKCRAKAEEPNAASDDRGHDPSVNPVSN